MRRADSNLNCAERASSRIRSESRAASCPRIPEAACAHAGTVGITDRMHMRAVTVAVRITRGHARGHARGAGATPGARSIRELGGFGYVSGPLTVPLSFTLTVRTRPADGGILRRQGERLFEGVPAE